MSHICSQLLAYVNLMHSSEHMGIFKYFAKLA